MYVVVPNSDKPMPISVVHIPNKLSSSPSPWTSPHSVLGRSPTYSPHNPSYHPSQWLDLMVSPVADHSKPLPGQLALTSAKRMIRGLPLVRRKRSSTITQHPPVYLQRNSSLPHANCSRTFGCRKPHKVRGPWPIHGFQHRQQPMSPSWTGVRQDSIESLRAGLRKTAQKVMRFRGLEKSQSFDVSGVYCGKSASKSSQKSAPKVHSPMVRFLGRGQSWVKHQNGRDKNEDSITSPEDSNEDYDLDSPDVEVIGLDEEEVSQYSDEEDIGPEVTNIEYSYKTLSTAFSDPTLNKSIYARESFVENQVSPGPLQFISSDEDTCSSELTSSNFSSPEHVVGLPGSTGPTQGSPQKFFISEEELTSQSSIESHFTGPVDINDLHRGLTRSLSDSIRSCSDLCLPTTPEAEFGLTPPVIQHPIPYCEKCNTFCNKCTRCEKPVSEGLNPESHAEQIDNEDCRLERKSGICMVTTPHEFIRSEREKTIILEESQQEERLVVTSGLDFNNKPEILSLELLPVRQPFSKQNEGTVSYVNTSPLPDIAVTPSTPILPTKSKVFTLPHIQQDINFTDSSEDSCIKVDVPNIKPSSSECITPCVSVQNSLPVSTSSPALTCSTSQIPNVIQPHYLKPSSTSSSFRSSVSASSNLSSLSSSSSSSFHQVASSQSMDSRELLQCALDVAAKCPSHPVYISSLDMLVEARPGSASMVGSPKRSSRSRHTSGCYPVSRSPLPIETDGSKIEAGSVGCAATNGSIPTHSPTHSGKLASPARTPGVSINRRSSDSDLSITPKGMLEILGPFRLLYERNILLFFQF